MNIKTDGKIIHDDIARDVPGAYPWQYKEYDIKSLILMPIEPDINAYWNEKALFRKGYKVDNENKEIYIPNFFIKINGKHKNDKEYIKFVRFLIDSKNTLVINKRIESNFPYNFLELKSENKLSAKEYIETRSFIKNKENAIEEFIEYYFNQEKNKNNNFSNIIYDKQLQIKKIMINTVNKYLDVWNVSDLESYLSVCFNIPANVIVLINNFDYNYDIPKLVFIDCSFGKKESFLVDLINELAFDIIILDTSGKTTLEKHVPIMSLSLGYFEENFNTYNKCLTLNKRASNIIREVETEKWGALINITSIILASILIILGLFFFNGWINTAIEILAIIVVISVGKFLCYNCMIENEDAHAAADTIFAAIVCVLLFARFFISIVSFDVSPDKTMTYTGSLEMADHMLDTKNDYIIYSKKDAVICAGTCKLNLYIENNEINEQDIYIKIYCGDDLYYHSSCISPYEYINLVDLGYTVGIRNDNKKITVKYYYYDKNKANSYTNILLGSEEINLHIAEDNEELEELLEEFNFKN